jgi:LmeA-like phospholipid-binding
VSRSASRRGQGRGGRRLVIALVIIVVLLLAADFGARAVAESVLADKLEQQGLPHKPDVSIGGFPFLTQVASRDFDHVTITTTDVPAGPVTLSTVDATATGIRLSSFAFNRGTIGTVQGAATISFASLANTLTKEVGPLGAALNGAGLNLAPAGPDEVRASINLIVTSGSATWRVTRVSSSQLNITLVNSSNLPSALLSSIQDITLQIPRLPLGLTIDSVTVTPAGVVGRVSGQDVPFGT